jgi:hypothetical protein
MLQTYNSMSEDEMFSAIRSIGSRLVYLWAPLGTGLVVHYGGESHRFGPPSIFRQWNIPGRRSCSDAGVSAHWDCFAHHWFGYRSQHGGEEEIEEDYDCSKPSLQGEILRAVAQNSHIMTFASCVELPQLESCQFISSPTLAVQTLRLEGSSLDSFDDATLLADAFGTNRSLQALYLQCTEGSGELTEQILR